MPNQTNQTVGVFDIISGEDVENAQSDAKQREWFREHIESVKGELDMPNSNPETVLDSIRLPYSDPEGWRMSIISPRLSTELNSLIRDGEGLTEADLQVMADATISVMAGKYTVAMMDDVADYRDTKLVKPTTYGVLTAPSATGSKSSSARHMLRPVDEVVSLHAAAWRQFQAMEQTYKRPKRKSEDGEVGEGSELFRFAEPSDVPDTRRHAELRIKFQRALIAWLRAEGAPGAADSALAKQMQLAYEELKQSGYTVNPTVDEMAVMATDATMEKLDLMMTYCPVLLFHDEGRRFNRFMSREDRDMYGDFNELTNGSRGGRARVGAGFLSIPNRTFSCLVMTQPGVINKTMHKEDVDQSGFYWRWNMPRPRDAERPKDTKAYLDGAVGKYGPRATGYLTNYMRMCNTMRDAMLWGDYTDNKMNVYRFSQSATAVRETISGLFSKLSRELHYAGSELRSSMLGRAVEQVDKRAFGYALERACLSGDPSQLARKVIDEWAVIAAYKWVLGDIDGKLFNWNVFANNDAEKKRMQSTSRGGNTAPNKDYQLLFAVATLAASADGTVRMPVCAEHGITRAKFNSIVTPGKNGWTNRGAKSRLWPDSKESKPNRMCEVVTYDDEDVLVLKVNPVPPGAPVIEWCHNYLQDAKKTQQK